MGHLLIPIIANIRNIKTMIEIWWLVYQIWPFRVSAYAINKWLVESTLDFVCIFHT